MLTNVLTTGFFPAFYYLGRTAKKDRRPTYPLLRGNWPFICRKCINLTKNEQQIA
jgi:hypothetical protein